MANRSYRMYLRKWLYCFAANLSLFYGIAHTAVANEMSMIDFEEIVESNTSGIIGPVGLAISPNGKDVYIANYEAANTIDGRLARYSRDIASGKLTFQEAKIHAQPGDGLAGIYDLMFSPDGEYLYIAGGVFNATLAVYQRNLANGELTSKTVISFDGNTLPALQRISTMKISKDGRYLYAAGQLSDFTNAGVVLLFGRSIDTGILTLLTKYRHEEAGILGLENPVEMVISVDGAALYVGSRSSVSSASIVHFARELETGELDYHSTVTDPDMLSIGDMEATSDSKSLYVTSPLNDMVLLFKRDFNSGQLTKVAGYTTPLAGSSSLSGARGIALNRYGSHVYVASSDEGSVRSYRRSLVDGQLTYIDQVINGANGVSGLNNAGGITRSFDAANLYVTPLLSLPETRNAGEKAGIVVMDIAARDLSLRIDDTLSAAAVNQVVTLSAEVTNKSGRLIDDVQYFVGRNDGVEFDLTNLAVDQGTCQAADNGVSCQLGSLVEDQIVHITIPGIRLKEKIHVVATVMGLFDDPHPEDNQVIISTVNKVNEPPIAVDDIVYVSNSRTVSLNLLANDYDPNGDEINLVSIDAPGTATFGEFKKLETGEWVFTPMAELPDSFEISYTIEDSYGATSSAKAIFLLNTVPIAGNDEVTTLINQPIDILVLFNDNELDTEDRLSIVQLITSLENLSISDTVGQVEVIERELSPGLSMQMVRYTPALDFVGVDHFQYVMMDDKGAESTSLVKVNVVAKIPEVSPASSGGPAIADANNKVSSGSGGGGSINFGVLLMFLLAPIVRIFECRLSAIFFFQYRGNNPKCRSKQYKYPAVQFQTCY